MGTARKLTRRQQVNSELACHGGQEKAYKSHVMVKRQPRNAAISGFADLQPVVRNGSHIGHTRTLGDTNPHGETGAARRELKVGK